MTTLEYTIYAGEVIELPIDLDTSATDTSYDLSAAVLSFNATAFGYTGVVLEADATAAEDDSGLVTVTLLDTSALAAGVYSFQLVDTAQPLVLAEGLLTVKPMFAAEVS